MFLLHILIPVIIFYFYRDKIILWGLLFANLIDIGHVYYRIIGKVGWFESACPNLGMQCSWNFYPFHNITMLIVGFLLSSMIFTKDKRLKVAGWFGVGIVLHFGLDYIHLLTGAGI